MASLSETLLSNMASRPSTPDSTASSVSTVATCRICHDEDCDDGFTLLADLCACKSAYVHSKCLQTWIVYKNMVETPTCEVCLQRYDLPDTFLQELTEKKTYIQNKMIVVAERSTCDLTDEFKRNLIPGVLAFLYGYCDNVLVQTANVSRVNMSIVGNIIVVAFWLICVVQPGATHRIRSRTRAITDFMALTLAYTAYVLGWAMQCMTLPRMNDPQYNLPNHLFNGIIYIFVATSRFLATC